MAWKLYTATNYLVLEDTANETLHRRLKYEVCAQKPQIDATIYEFWDGIGLYLRVKFSDLQDSTGAAWADVATLEAWLNANTGLGDSTAIVTSLADLKKREDAVHASGDFGIMALAVANEAAINLSGTDGDYTPIRVKRDGTVYTLADSNFYSSTIVIDDNYTAFERRISYSPTTRLYTIAFYVPGTNTVGAPSGTVQFPEEQHTVWMDDIWSKLINAGTEEAVGIGNFSRIAVGGKTVSAAGYIPASGFDESMMLAFDALNGRALVQDDKLEATVNTTIEVDSADTSFVMGGSVDMRTFSEITIVPEVTSEDGTYAEYKVQWSMDNVNWFDETVDTAGAASGVFPSKESLIDQPTMIRRFESASTGFKGHANCTLSKNGRYVRFGHRSDAAATSVSVTYHYQLLK